jgi:deoxycytidylate deaminase
MAPQVFRLSENEEVDMSVSSVASFKKVSANQSGSSSKTAVLAHASNELVIAVVGHVGSGTSEIAKTLEALLTETETNKAATKVEIIKATDIIAAWATKNGVQPPSRTEKNKTLDDVRIFQDLGDRLRKETGDHAAVAKGLAIRIRELRAQSQAVNPAATDPVVPDGAPRAYILDSIRHPAEVELLRHIYQDAFVLIGVVCEESKRLRRVTDKYTDAGRDKALEFMKRDAKAIEKHGQRVSDAFHLADFFIDNTADRHKDDRSPNPDWDIPEKLSRLVKIVRHTEIVRPELSETAMSHAQGAAFRSACLSRQVGAALADRSGNILATGCNEVARAGGGVYGDVFDASHAEDHRCAYRHVKDSPQPYCSNTREQNAIIKELIEDIAKVKGLTQEEQDQLKSVFRDGRVGSLIEFSRAVHAEMDAILSAARTGASTVGGRLFVTTFPCHYCARHIVAAGIDEVQYIEPYPKSQALELHPDSIATTAHGWKVPSSRVHFPIVVDGQGAPAPELVKVLFRPFTGVAPRLYKRAFAKDRDLKNSSTGDFELGSPDWGTPWHLRRMSYPQLESELAAQAN